jgi:hypothetical protein
LFHGRSLPFYPKTVHPAGIGRTGTRRAGSVGFVRLFVPNSIPDTAPAWQQRFTATPEGWYEAVDLIPEMA